MKEDLTTLLAASTLAIITTVFWPECTLLWAIPVAVMLGTIYYPKEDVGRSPPRKSDETHPQRRL